jgi:putative spermidine/putrescine transport system substrate-binding protein
MLLTRRSILGLLSTGAAAASTARSLFPAPAIAKDQATLTVSTWGGITSDGLRDYVGPEFEKQTGAKLAFDIGGQGARYNKLLAQKGNQTADVFFGSDEAIVGGLRQGLLEPADRKAVTHAADLYDWAVTVKAEHPDTQIAAVPYTMISYVLAYDPRSVKVAPTSWADLWRPEFQGKLAFAAPGHSVMPALVTIAAELAGGSVSNVDPGFAKLGELRPNKLTFFWTDWAPMIKTGDTVAATEFDYYVEAMKAQGYPIDYVFPKEGAIGSPECAALVAGSKNREIAQVFLNLLIDPKVQETFAVKTIQGPTNKTVKVGPEIAGKMSYGEAKLKQVRFFDPVIAFENRPAWTERLTTEVLPNWQAN